jgi:hypothetical protein
LEDNIKTLANVKVTALPQQAEVAQGVPGRLRPTDFLDVRHYKGGRSLPQEKSLVLIFRG